MQEIYSPSEMLTLDDIRNKQFLNLEDLKQLCEITMASNYALTNEPNLSSDVKMLLCQQSEEAIRCYALVLMGIYPQRLLA